MNPAWTEFLWWLGLAVTVIVTQVFAWRYLIGFWRQVKDNRAAGVYDDPEFKRRIRPLNIVRYSLLGVELLSIVPGVWALIAGVPRDTVAAAWFAFLVPVAIWSLVVDRRWRRLMTRGLDEDDAPTT